MANSAYGMDAAVWDVIQASKPSRGKGRNETRRYPFNCAYWEGKTCGTCANRPVPYNFETEELCDVHWRKTMAASYWNHNSAYYPWVVEKTGGCHSVLDVGCGNGELALMLACDGHCVTGVDPSERCIAEAKARENGQKARFARASFEDFKADEPFDAITFVASIHHMDMERAITKAKELLAPVGVIVIVGLASPSSVLDHAIEVLRIVPSWVSSRVHRMRTSEDLGVPTSYATPSMAEVRDIASRLLPGAAIRYGLYWRYLLTWRKP